MRKYDEYLATIDTIYPDRYERETYHGEVGGAGAAGAVGAYVIGDLLPPAPMPVRAGVIAFLLDTCGNWLARRAGRKILREMGDDQLADIGVTRIAAHREARRSRFIL